MAHIAWEKEQAAAETWEKPADIDLSRLTKKRTDRWKFMLGGVLILGAVLYLVISGTLTGVAYFITVDQVLSDPSYVGQNVRISGAVLGDTIQNDLSTQTISFTITHIPQDFRNLAEALHISVNDPSMSRLTVQYVGTMPDLLQHEAQAILTGRLGEDGVFYASELLLKCPSRFEEGGSDASIGEDHPGMQFNAG